MPRSLSSLSPATICRRPASAPCRAAHQLSFANQCSTALFSTPFLRRRRLLTQEVSTANEFPQGKQTNTKQTKNPKPITKQNKPNENKYQQMYMDRLYHGGGSV